MGVLLSIPSQCFSFLSQAAAAPFVITWVLFTPLRWIAEAIYWLLRVIWAVLSFFFNIFFFGFYLARSLLTGVQGGMIYVNTWASLSLDQLYTPPVVARWFVPWVLVTLVLKLIKATGKHLLAFLGAFWKSLLATLFFSLLLLVFLGTAYPLLQLETQPDQAFNLATVMFAGLEGVYTLFAGTYNFARDLIRPLMPFVQLATALAWKFIIITVEGVLATVFGNEDLGNTVEQTTFRALKDAPPQPPAVLPYHRALALDMPISRPHEVGSRELIGLFEFSTTENERLPIPSLVTGMKQWEMAWTSSFSLLYSMFDLLGDIFIVMWELWLKIFFPIVRDLFTTLFEYLTNAGCCAASPWCCAARFASDIVQGLLSALNLVLGRLVSIFTGEVPQIIDPSIGEFGCTDNDIPGRYLCECADFYTKVTPCDPEQRECLEIGTNRYGQTIYSEVIVKEGSEPLTVAENTDRQVGCPSFTQVEGSRTLREVKRRRLQTPIERNCHELRRLPTCIRDRKRSWLVQVADCSAERLIYLGGCNGGEGSGIETLTRYMRTRRGLNTRVTPKYTAPPPTSPPAPKPPPHPGMEGSDGLCGTGAGEEPTSQTVSRLVCFANERLGTVKKNLDDGWIAQRARDIVYGRREEEPKKEKGDQSQEKLFFFERTTPPPKIEDQGVLWHHTAHIVRRLRHAARVWKQEGGGRPDHVVGAIHATLINAHVKFMRERGLTTRVGEKRGIMTFQGEEMGRYTFQLFIKNSQLVRKRRAGERKLEERRRLGSTAGGATVNTNPEGVNYNIEVGVASETGVICEYQCPDGSCIPLSQTSQCKYPEVWTVGTYFRYFFYLLREASLNADYRILMDGVWECWNNYEKFPETDPVRREVFIQLAEAYRSGNYEEYKRIQSQFVYCFPLFRDLPPLPQLSIPFQEWAEEQCGVVVGSRGERILGCTCPQYWDQDNVGNYGQYWMVASPAYVKARILTTLHMYRYLITYSMALSQGKLDTKGQLLSLTDDTGGFWWTISSLIPWTPEWYRNMFSYQAASAGMTFGQNMFCVGLSQGSHIFVILFLYYPLFIFFTYFYEPVGDLFNDLGKVFMFFVKGFFLFLQIQAIKHGGVPLHVWQEERKAQIQYWVEKAKKLPPRFPATFKEFAVSKYNPFQRAVKGAKGAMWVPELFKKPGQIRRWWKGKRKDKRGTVSQLQGLPKPLTEVLTGEKEKVDKEPAPLEQKFDNWKQTQTLRSRAGATSDQVH